MSGFLLDTNVLSEFSRRDGPNPTVAAWLRRTSREDQYVSVVTLAEIERRIHLLEPGRRRESLENWLATDVDAWFEGRILTVTRVLASRWARLQAGSSKAGRTLSTLDSLIAATAAAHDLALVTRNVRDFEGLGVTVVDPWK